MKPWQGEFPNDAPTRTTVYFVDGISASEAAELADVLAHASDGKVIACDVKRAIIETSDTEQDRDTETAYLHQLCDEDDRVTAWGVR